jgi:N-acetyl-anhydromuramyl-L-alanine amidase AmpD
MRKSLVAGIVGSVLLLLAVVALTEPAAQARSLSRRNGPPPVPRGWVPQIPSDRWDCIVIHHSATDFGGARRFDTGHREKGWDGLGYHFVVGNGSDTRDGLVEVGPRWIEQRTGAHCRSPEDYYNEHGIGICLVGNFDEGPPSPAQMQSLTKLVRYLCRKYDIPASKVYTHGGLTHLTACPGKHFDLKALRRSIKN